MQGVPVSSSGCSSLKHNPIALLAEREAACREQAAEANAAVAEARRLADAAEARAQAAETAKIELSLQLAELAAEAESAADVSGLPSRTLDMAADDLSQADHLHRRWVASKLFALCFWGPGQQCNVPVIMSQQAPMCQRACAGDCFSCTAHLPTAVHDSIMQPS